jgi:hypothetical protein
LKARKIINYIINNKQLEFKKLRNFVHFNETDVFKPEYYSKSNNQIKHKLAADNASSIIDFDKLKYAGGPRNVEVIRPGNIWTELTNLLEQTIFPDETCQILYLLGAPFRLATITGFGAGFNPLAGVYMRDITTFNSEMSIDFANFNNWIDRTIPQINQPFLIANPQFLKDQVIDMKFYTLMAITAIQNPDYFIQIKYINIPSTSRTGLDELIFANSEFAKKWFDIYTQGGNLSSGLYGMWCDIMCKFSDSNLECAVPIRLLMLMGTNMGMFVLGKMAEKRFGINPMNLFKTTPNYNQNNQEQQEPQNNSSSFSPPPKKKGISPPEFDFEDISQKKMN